MLISAYRPLSAEEPTFSETKITDITQIISYQYSRKMTEVGGFKLEIPSNIPLAEMLVPNTILHVDNQDSLVIRLVTETESTYVIEGNDLKDFFTRRLTEFPPEEQVIGAYGHDVVKGSTEKCIRHYLENNITNAINANRNIFGLKLVNNQDRGLQNDSYMSRLEPLNQLVQKMCENAGIGYDISISLLDNEYRYNIIEPVDKTDHQTENNKVIFAIEFRNIKSLKHIKDNGNEKNAIYAINGGELPIVQTVYREEKQPQGLFRNETSVNISCDIPYISLYALNATEEMMASDSFELEAGNIKDYGTLYDLGDKVTFKYKSHIFETIITEIVKDYNGNELNLKIVTGKKTPKTINGILKSNRRASIDIKETVLNNKVPPPIQSISIESNTSIKVTTKYGVENFGSEYD